LVQKRYVIVYTPYPVDELHALNYLLDAQSTRRNLDPSTYTILLLLTRELQEIADDDDSLSDVAYPQG
jgi:hypothetical protein